MPLQVKQIGAAKWIRNKTGNSALGTLYSPVKESLMLNNISISEARILYPEYAIYEDKEGHK